MSHIVKVNFHWRLSIKTISVKSLFFSWFQLQDLGNSISKQLDKVEKTIEKSLVDGTSLTIQSPSLAIQLEKKDFKKITQKKNYTLLGTTVILPDLETRNGRIVVKVMNRLLLMI